MRRRWIYIKGVAVPVEESSGEVVAPLVMPDIKPYRSMIDGSVVESRSRHRDHLKRHNVFEVGNENLKPKPADLRKTGVKEALVDSLKQAKEQHGSRTIERAITDTLNRAYEIRNRR